MSNSHDGRRWYLTAIATTYLVLCTGGCWYYASQYFSTRGAMVPLANQLLCLGMVVAAAIYFFRPKFGHLGLLALTSITIVAIGESDPNATRFHLCVMLILLIPLLGSKRTLTPSDALMASST